MRKIFSKKERAEVFNKTNGRCGYCGETLVGRWNVDHMRSICDGGNDDSKEEIADFKAGCNCPLDSFCMFQNTCSDWKVQKIEEEKTK